MNIAQISIVNSVQLLYNGEILPVLLVDRTTRNHIVWATDEYKTDNNRLTADRTIDIVDITGEFSNRIRPRYSKTLESQKDRTKRKAEVFTPAWICNRMNNDFDEYYLEYKTAFNIPHNKTWETTSTPIVFVTNQKWKEYVDLTRLEITCGEAPFVTSRYYPATGEMIAVSNRIGFLDRKLRVVAENARGIDYEKWSLRALQSSYGYEYQGDNLLIARINVFMTWYENFIEVMGVEPSIKVAKEAAKIISWNFWQMDGLTGSVPMKPLYETNQITIFDLLGDSLVQSTEETYSKIFDWRAGKNQTYNSLKGASKMKKFYAVVGNPAYQETLENTSDKPIYNYFMEEAYKISDRVEMITPARFLFNAGKTPKAWNEKMLNDPHFKVLSYASDAKVYFADNDIQGGIAISYRDATKNFGAIEVFSSFEEINSIRNKIVSHVNFHTIFDEMISSFAYHFTPQLHIDHPEVEEIMSKGHSNDVTTNVFEKLPHIFLEEKPSDGNSYLKMYGRLGNERTFRYVRSEYINDVSNINFYKLYLSKADGAAGTIGNPVPARIIGRAFIAEPGSGATASFFSVGSFKTLTEAENAKKYLETKFARTALSVLKITQDATPTKWKYVPTQNFTNKSDIDWSKSLSEIDDQLYSKYGFSEKEIAFIDKYVKEMS